MSALAFTILVVMPVGQSGEGRPKVPFDQLQAVKREYEQIFQEYTRARAKAKTDKEIEKAGQVRRARTRPLLRLRSTWRENPRYPVAYDAPEWVVNSGLVDFPEVVEALDLLLKDHIANKNLGPAGRKMADEDLRPLKDRRDFKQLLEEARKAQAAAGR